jgi:uncharacterized protein involved in response to NO
VIKNLPLFSIGFRPFFILAAFIAMINPLLWILDYLGHFDLILNTSSLFWHGHEMIFGFTGALIAGFILTASSNWTGTLPYKGSFLIGLTVLWLVERISYFIPLPNTVHFILMNMFFPILTIMLGVQLWKFPKQRNVFIPILVGLTVGKLLHSGGYLFSQQALELSAKDMSLALIRLLVLLLAGRVIPFFTTKKIKGLEVNVPAWLNRLALTPLILLALPWPGSTPVLLISLLLAWALASNLLRFCLWKPHKTIKVPILFILNIGAIIILLSMLQELIGLFNDRVFITKATLHLLMAGGLGIISIGIMTRVSLGHTGRTIVADKWIQLSYISIIIGALIRSWVPIFYFEQYATSLYPAVLLWTLGFAIFLIRFVVILITPRPDET